MNWGRMNAVITFMKLGWWWCVGALRESVLSQASSRSNINIYILSSRLVLLPTLGKVGGEVMESLECKALAKLTDK